MAGRNVKRFHTVEGTTSATLGNMTTVAHGMTDMAGRPIVPAAVMLTPLGAESDGTATTAASVSAVTKSDATSETVVISGTYTGRKVLSYKMVVTGVVDTADAANVYKVNQIQVFADGVYVATHAVDGATGVVIGNGLTATFDDDGTTTSKGDFYTFTATNLMAVANANPVVLVEVTDTNLVVRCATASTPFIATLLF